MTTFKTFLFLILIRFIVSKDSLTATRYLLVSRVGPCRDRKPSELVIVSEMSLHKENYDSTLSGELSVTKDVENGWSVKALMQKCYDIRNLDTCDFYKSVAIVKNGCLESDEADVYNMFYQYVTPKMDCPVKAGNYTITDFPFFTENSDLKATESMMSTSIFGYTYRLEGYNDNEERILCVETHLRLNYLRQHNWTGKKKKDIKTTPPSAKEDSEQKSDKETGGDGENSHDEEGNDGNKRNADNDGDDDD